MSSCDKAAKTINYFCKNVCSKGPWTLNATGTKYSWLKR